MAVGTSVGGPTTISFPSPIYEEPELTTWELVKKLASQIFEKLREGCRAFTGWLGGTSVVRSLGEYAVFAL